ncbi:unnamed protein product [Trifolium pratense]|uniref:Uncharacterized protein n=1 Tax=Trifolium pratense TaxID=57577 RepID=A0ACB0IM04_TRIPR|nr:unnamed protein product [Trifolium pratense]
MSKFDVAVDNGTKAQESDGCQISTLNENKSPAKRISSSDTINGDETRALSKHSLNFSYLATIRMTRVFKLHEENKRECH